MITEIAAIEIAERLPNRFAVERGGAVPDGLRGAKIVNFGMPSDPRLFEGGGLVIDYLPAGKKQVERVVFSFNELAMWVEGQGELGSEVPRPRAG